MDLALFTQWAGAAGLVLGIVNMFWNMAGRAAKPVNDKIAALDVKVEKYRGDLAGHDRRIQSLEGLVPHMPTAQQVHGLQVTVERLDVHLGGLEKAMEGFGRMVTRIDDYLRENKS